jgi:hypothetical protein
MLRLSNAPCPLRRANRLVMLLAAVAVLPACGYRRGLQSVEHPETGYVFPSTSEITTMEFEGRDAGFLPDFPVPRRCWDTILKALSPSQASSRAPWEKIGVLRISTRSGAVHWVRFYAIEDEPVGAFSAGPRENSPGAFRGGNSKILKDALKDAYRVYSQQGTNKK